MSDAELALMILRKAIEATEINVTYMLTKLELDREERSLVLRLARGAQR